MFITAGPTPSLRKKRSLRTTISRLAAAAAVSVALMTAAAPAMAMEDPSNGSSGERTPAPVQVQDNGFLDVSSAALGALAGLALGGIGLGITLTVQRHRDHAAVPTV
jgi:hypothetical protein